jgi:hypothetical protein
MHLRHGHGHATTHTRNAQQPLRLRPTDKPKGRSEATTPCLFDRSVLLALAVRCACARPASPCRCRKTNLCTKHKWFANPLGDAPLRRWAATKCLPSSCHWRTPPPQCRGACSTTVRCLPAKAQRWRQCQTNPTSLAPRQSRQCRPTTRPAQKPEATPTAPTPSTRAIPKRSAQRPIHMPPMPKPNMLKV